MHASFEWFRDHIHAFCLNFKNLKKYPGGPPGYFSKIWVFSEKWLDIFFWPKLFFCATSCYSFDRMRASQNKISTIFHILAKLPRSKQKVTCVRAKARFSTGIKIVFIYFLNSQAQHTEERISNGTLTYVMFEWCFWSRSWSTVEETTF